MLEAKQAVFAKTVTWLVIQVLFSFPGANASDQQDHPGALARHLQGQRHRLHRDQDRRRRDPRGR